MRAISRLLLIAATTVSTPAWAEPLIDLQRAVAAAEKRAEEQAAVHDRLHQDTLTALSRGAAAAFIIAEQREEAAMVGDLQSVSALRRNRQGLTEAVNGLIEQADAIEHAAARAARGEVAPSASDLLACDGPDCVTVSPREHGALVLVGAVAPSFDRALWPPADTLLQITVLRSDGDPALATMRTAAEKAGLAAHDAATKAESLRALATDPAAMKIYAEALVAADAARAAQNAAGERLQKQVRLMADTGRALKRAALLAGDGYTLQRGGHKACSGDICVSAEGLEAAAFVVIGAAEDMSDGTKGLGAYVVKSADNAFVFR